MSKMRCLKSHLTVTLAPAAGNCGPVETAHQGTKGLFFRGWSSLPIVLSQPFEYDDVWGGARGSI